MSVRKAVVRTYLAGFRRTDHAEILSCLTDDVVWEMPGYFTVAGKAAFDGQIENEQADGHPDITADRLYEADDVVIAVGAVQAKLKQGAPVKAAFCDVFTFRGAKICRLETYLVDLNH